MWTATRWISSPNADAAGCSWRLTLGCERSTDSRGGRSAGQTTCGKAHDDETRQPALVVPRSPRQDIRGDIEAWIERMNGRNTLDIRPNIPASGGDYITVEYMEQDVSGDDVDGGVNDYQRKIKLVNAFPVELSPMEFSYDTPDTFAEFAVTFTYDYWEYQGV